jgi:hypothetical protein
MMLPLMVLAANTAIAFGQTGPAIPFVTVTQGNASGVREPAQLVIRDQAAWLALWGRHRGSTKGPAPSIDFERDMVLAIFGGESREVRRVAIGKIVREPDRIEVWYTFMALPGPDGEGVPPVVPFQIVRLARSALPVRFVRAKTQPVY